MTSINEVIIERLTNCGTPVSQVSHDTRIPIASLYLFRLGRKALSVNNIQKLIDYFGLEVRRTPVKCK
jgi:hypothetical protein